MSTGSDVFSLFVYLASNKFVLLSFCSLVKTIYPRFSTKTLPNDSKSPLAVDVRRSKHSLCSYEPALFGLRLANNES